MEPLEVVKRMSGEFDLDEAVDAVRRKFFRTCSLADAEQIYEDYVALKIIEAQSLLQTRAAEEAQDALEKQKRSEAMEQEKSNNSFDMWKLPEAKEIPKWIHEEPMNPMTSPITAHCTAQDPKAKPVCCVVQ